PRAWRTRPARRTSPRRSAGSSRVLTPSRHRDDHPRTTPSTDELTPEPFEARQAMTATTVDSRGAAPAEPATGRVARVIGPVVDIEFPEDSIPDIYNALTVELDLSGMGEGENKFTLTLETAQ